MRHQSRNGEDRKKRLKPVTDGTKTGKEPGDQTDNADDDIDPADFFDPEEFGFLRRGFNASRP
jgi:hypothetical protein